MSIKALLLLGITMVCAPRAVHAMGEVLFSVCGMRRRPEVPIDRAKNILVVRLDEIGDVVLMSAFLRELRQSAPAAHITLIVKPEIHNLVELCPHVDEVLVFDRRAEGDYASLRRHLRALKIGWQHLWRRRFEVALLPRWDVDYYHASFLAYLSGAARRVGYAQDVNPLKSRLHQGYDRLLTERLDDRRPRHEVEYDLSLLQHLGGRVNHDRLEVWLSQADRCRARELLGPAVTSPRLVAFGIGAGAPCRMWPVDKFAELGRWVASTYRAQILLLGGADEMPKSQELCKHLGAAAVDCCGRATLRETAALLSFCELYIGNDTGVMHLAAAQGLPVIEISSHPLSGAVAHAQSPVRFRPWGVPSVILQPSSALDPCKEACVALEPHCICSISVEAAQEAVGRLWHQARSARQAPVEQLPQVA